MKDLIEKIDKEGYERISKELGINIEKEDQVAMNKTSIGVCATKETISK